MKTVFLICGETGCGKDTIVNKVCKETGLKQLVSYTTRPRRENEGDTHIFIKPEEFVDVISKDDVIAYTEINSYKYFATYGQLKDADFYIIDPCGIEYLHSQFQALHLSDYRFVTVLIHVPDNIRMFRLGKRKDNELTVYKRCFSERNQFQNMYLNHSYDYAIANNNVNKAAKVLLSIIAAEKMHDTNQDCFVIGNEKNQNDCIVLNTHTANTKYIPDTSWAKWTELSVPKI